MPQKISRPNEVHTRLSDKENKRLVELCDELGTSKSSLLRMAFNALKITSNVPRGTK